jgi:hypothetical protein
VVYDVDGVVERCMRRALVRAEAVPEEEQYDVEALRATRRHGAAVQRLVKWEGWPEEDNTWEAESSLPADTRNEGDVPLLG